METINPFGNEQVQTNEQMAAELRAELESLERRKAYLLEMLATVDPEEKARQEFIDRAYEGS